MAEKSSQKKFLYEGAAARYRALMVKTSDPARRRMLADMIARELETLKRGGFIAGNRARRGDAGTA